MNLCECGCGQEVAHKQNKFISNHYNPMKDLKIREKLIQDPNFGFQNKHHSPKSKMKMSIKRKGKPKFHPNSCQCPWCRTKRGEWIPNKGRKFPKELYPNYGWRGKTQSLKTRLKRSKKRKELYKTNLLPRKSWNKGKTKETCASLARVAISVSKAMKGKKLPHLSGCTCFRCRIKRGEFVNPMECPELREKAVRNLFLSLRKRPNKKERMLDNFIQQNNFPFDYVGDGKLIIGGFCPDWANNDGSKKIIELYGDYWHKDSRERDKKRIETYSKYGFKTLVIWEHELKEPEKVVEEIRGFADGF